jgi:prolyl 4-hydroxylase
MNRFWNVLCILVAIFVLWTHRNTVVTRRRIVPEHEIVRKHPNFPLYVIRNCLSPEECELFKMTAISTLQRSSTISNTPISNVRTSHNTFLNPNLYMDTPIAAPMRRLEDIAQRMSGMPPSHNEAFQVVRYEPGQYYREHYDACVPEDAPMCRVDAEGHGLRFATLLVYLNDLPEDAGGETHFPKLNATVRPRAGHAVFFMNVDPNDHTKHHPLSKHASLDLKKGTKWICNLWIRCKPYQQKVSKKS